MAAHLPLSQEKAFAVPDDLIWRLSVAQYHHMVETGILTEDDPVELLEGWLVAKMPKKPRHSLATQLTRDALSTVMPAGWFIADQEPITLTDSEPEPDVLVIRGSRRDYKDRHPGAEDVTLIVEVADATLHRDRSLKLRVYAEAGIPSYWILNLQEDQLEVYTQPVGQGTQAAYQQRVDFSAVSEVPVLIDGQEISRIRVRDLLP